MHNRRRLDSRTDTILPPLGTAINPNRIHPSATRTNNIKRIRTDQPNITHLRGLLSNLLCSMLVASWRRLVLFNIVHSNQIGKDARVLGEIWGMQDRVGDHVSRAV